MRYHGFLTSMLVVILAFSLVGCVEDQQITTNPVQETTETVTTETSTVTVVFLNVGQGNAVLVRGEGYDALIDFGKNEEKLRAELKEQGITHLDYLFVTHPDQDHYGAWQVLTNEGYINNDTEFYHPTFYFREEQPKGYKTMLMVMYGMGVDITEINTEDNLIPNEVHKDMRLLWPDPQFSEIIKEKNDNSLVFDIGSGKSHVLLTGDIENPVEQVLYAPTFPINENGNKINVFMASHHGSEYCSAPALLSKTKPEVAVISVGKNSYGHPSPITVRRLEVITKKYGNGKVYRTDLDDTVTVFLNGEDYRISAE